jgi:hypothetical protein
MLYCRGWQPDLKGRGEGTLRLLNYHVVQKWCAYFNPSASSNIFMDNDYHLQAVTEIEKKSDYSTCGYWL